MLSLSLSLSTNEQYVLKNIYIYRDLLSLLFLLLIVIIFTFIFLKNREKRKIRRMIKTYSNIPYHETVEKLIPEMIENNINMECQSKVIYLIEKQKSPEYDCLAIAIKQMRGLLKAGETKLFCDFVDYVYDLHHKKDCYKIR